MNSTPSVSVQLTRAILQQHRLGQVLQSRAPSHRRKPLWLAYDSLGLASRGFYGGGVSYGGLWWLGEWSTSLIIHTFWRRH